MTNNMDWAPSSICDLYKSRWAIEVFFKEIKQTLQLCDFFGHNQNAVTWQIWTAMLLYILIRFLACKHSWDRGFKRLFCLLRSCVWDAMSIKSLVGFCGTAGGTPGIVASPQDTWIPGLEP
jgi:DDE family transposase